jgi:transcriptional regulator with XRE-family HTH domain
VVLAEGVVEIRILRRQGVSVREIARRTGVSRNTVRRYLKSADDPGYTARPAVAGKLDVHKVFLSERVAAAHPDRIPGTVLLSELRLRGYEATLAGSPFYVSIWRLCVQEWRPKLLFGSRRSPVDRCRWTGRGWSRFRRRSRWNTRRGGYSPRCGSVVGVCSGAGAQPDGLRAVRHGRAVGDADGVPRGGGRVLRRHTARGAVRQHADCGDRPGRVWSG